MKAEERDQVIRENLGYMLNREIGKMVGRTATQVTQRIAYMRKKSMDIPSVEEVKVRKKNRSIENVRFIEENYTVESKDIAKVIGRSLSYVNLVKRELIEKGKIASRKEQSTAIQERRNRELKKQILESEKERKLKQVERRKERERLSEISSRKERREVEEIYQRALSRKAKVEHGVMRSKMRIELGKVYEVERLNYMSKDISENFKGKAIQTTPNHFTLKCKHRAETFLKVDFLIGEYGIKEVAK